MLDSKTAAAEVAGEPIGDRSRLTRLLSSIPRAGHRSWWLQDVGEDAPDATRLIGTRSADVGVIGGGYVGLWSAIEIKLREPAVDVALLEADVCGSGASGRNGGFAMTWWSKVALLAPFIGDEETVRLARASVAGIDDIRQLFADHDVDCDLEQSGWLWTAAHTSQLDAWASTMQTCRRLGVRPFQELSREEIARRTGSPVHVGGVFDRDTARVHPAKLVRGLRKIAIDLGVRIYEHSPVQLLDRRRPAQLVTPDGLLRADKVVLAHNVWAAGMPEFRRKLAAISSDMIVTAPIADRLEQIGWTGNEVISDSQLAVHYYQTTADRRIAFGKGGGAVAFGGRIGPGFDRSPKRAVEVIANFHRLYPSLRDVPIVTDWCGAIDRSVTGVPIIGHTGGLAHIVHAVGWSANAVGPSRVGGQLLASLVLEADDQFARSTLIDLPAQNFPPEPIRFLGSKLVRAGVIRKETAELQDRRPTRIDALLAAQVPAGMIPKD